MPIFLPLLLAFAIAATLLALAGLHFYWAMGGRWGAASALPEHVSGQPVFRPSPLATGVVALGLLAAALVVLAAGWYRVPGLPSAWVEPATWGLAGLFGLRAVGDFRYVGFGKRVRGTRFAMLDTRFYSPLCAALAGGCAVLAAIA